MRWTSACLPGTMPTLFPMLPSGVDGRWSGVLAWTIASVIAAASPAQAAVTWERTEQRVAADAAAEMITFTFRFSVSGNAVTFQASDIPCGCAFAEPDRPTYQPGERGVFTVRMLVEDRVGTQEVEVIAKTGDPAKPEQVLALTAVIPELLRFDRKIAVWDKASGQVPLQLTCTVAAGFTATTARAASEHNAVVANVTKTADPQVFTVELSLVDPNHRKPVKVVVTTDLPVKRQATVTLWAVNRLP